MLRKLASVRKIRDIKQIDGANAIELAFVDGWQCVIKKNEFKIGDLCIYCEIDSFLPEKPEFEFLRKSSFRTMADGSTGFRLRTINLRGQLSQGLLLNINSIKTNVSEGDDVTEILGIKKYEAPIPACLSGEVKGKSPGLIKKTDQERIQNLIDYFEKYIDLEFELTEKLNGASMTVFYNQEDVGVCGREWELKETDGNSLWKVARRMELIEKLSELKKNIALQGEIIGEGIESNQYKLSGQRFKIYDIWDIDRQYHLTSKERLETIKILGLKETDHVPILSYSKIFKELKTVNEILKSAIGQSSLANVKREGIVFKSSERIGPQIISFKVIGEE